MLRQVATFFWVGVLSCNIFLGLCSLLQQLIDLFTCAHHEEPADCNSLNLMFLPLFQLMDGNVYVVHGCQVIRVEACSV